jgi:hypothetical protein
MADPVTPFTNPHPTLTERPDGKPVFDRDGEKLGVAKTISVDEGLGEVEFVAVSFGGLLGVGERLHPLPWRLLSFDAQRDGFVVDLDRAALEASPGYSSDWLTGDESWGGEVRTYYAGLGGGSNLV